MIKLMLLKILIMKTLIVKLVEILANVIENKSKNKKIKNYKLEENDYNLKYQAFDYTISVNEQLDWDNYVKHVWSAINSIDNFNNYNLKIVWIKDLEWDNGTNIHINEVITFNSNITFHDFYKKLTQFNSYNNITLGKDNQLNVWIKFFKLNIKK